MASPQHGGYAAQAKRRGEQYLMCNHCGRQHPRIKRLQMAYEPESRGVLRGCLSWITAMAVSVLITVICVWALFTVLGNV